MCSSHRRARFLWHRLIRSSVAALVAIGVSGSVLSAVEPGKNADDTSATSADKSKPAASDGDNLDALLDLADKAPERLQSIGVKESPRSSGAGTEMVFNPDTATNAQATSTGGLLSNALGVVVRSTSALNQDVRIRGYSGSQLVGIADGMNQMKTRLDIDSLFSQIDPNLVETVNVISGPYSVEYGPGFAFFDAQLIAPQRADKLTFSSESIFGYTTNGQQLMWRETAGYANQHSGAIFSLGQRMGNDYRPGATPAISTCRPATTCRMRFWRSARTSHNSAASISAICARSCVTPNCPAWLTTSTTNTPIS